MPTGNRRMANCYWRKPNRYLGIKLVICHMLGLVNIKKWDKEEYSVQCSEYKTISFFTRHVKASIDRKTSKVLLSWDPGIKLIIPSMALKNYLQKYTLAFHYFNSFTLRIFSSKYIQKKNKHLFSLQEYPDMMIVFLFCCSLVYAMKEKNFQISPTPVIFCLEKELTRDSFMHYLKSYSERSAPWGIDSSSLFRSLSSCLHHLCY